MQPLYCCRLTSLQKKPMSRLCRKMPLLSLCLLRIYVNKFIFPTPKSKKFHKAIVADHHTCRVVTRMEADPLSRLQISVNKELYPMSIREKFFRIGGLCYIHIVNES